VNTPFAPSRRVRHTTVLSLPAVERLMEEALAGLPPRRREPRRQQLLGLLQAFQEASRPAGGLPLDDRGRPLELARLRAEGARLSADGAGAERLWRKLRRAEPMDHRLAEAVMHFFRQVLGRPGLELEQLGAVAGERHAALRRIEAAVKAARDDVPAEILGAFVTRATEAAQVSVALADYVRHYGNVRGVVDEHGVARLHLRQTNRYRPVRLVSHAARHPLRLTAEWFQWNRTPVAALCLRPLDAALQPVAERAVPLRKALRDGFVVVEADPALAPDLAGGLPLQDAAGQARFWEVEWRLDMVFNAADRDILVNYAPIVRPRVQVEPAALASIHVAVGDSPGLARDANGWLLDRTLLPREVLAIRLRSRAIDDAQASQASPSGELRGISP
jgi:hypothetical protein